jgi:CRISPR-associated protein Csd2
MANGNGDPGNANRPRTDNEGHGELSDVCIKHKIRNRMQDMGHYIFVQSDDRNVDGYDSLKARADGVLSTQEKTKKSSKEKKSTFEERNDYAKKACEKFIDVRTFGQTFAYSSDDNSSGGMSLGVRGPVSIHQARSISPVDIYSQQITKGVNGTSSEKRSSDTMGTKHMVRFGLYEIKGAINVQLAQKTGFTDEDAETVKECLRTLFVNDASAARPEGSMEVVKLYWWKHNCEIGQYSSAKVHRSVKAVLKDGVIVPKSVDDYDFEVENLPGLEPEIIDGI